jgi:hypothetical protein
VAGEPFQAALHVANDGPALAGVEVEARLLGSAAVVALGDLPGYRAGAHGRVELAAPDVPGNHDLVLRLRSRGAQVAENRYPLHVVARPQARTDVRMFGWSRVTADALERLGANVDDRGPVVVAEGALDPTVAIELRSALADGEAVVILAQQPDAAQHYPLPATLVPTLTKWGSSVFNFTTDHGGLPSLPRRAMLAGEDATVQATSVLTRLGGDPWPDVPLVVAYKPVPNQVVGTVVGAHRVGRGWVVACQYRLAARVVAGDPAAGALLADLVRFATDPPRGMRAERIVKDDGRSLTFYSFPKAGAAQPGRRTPARRDEEGQ